MRGGEEGRHPTLPLLTPPQAHYSQDTTGLDLEPKWLEPGLRTWDVTVYGLGVACL